VIGVVVVVEGDFIHGHGDLLFFRG